MLKFAISIDLGLPYTLLYSCMHSYRYFAIAVHLSLKITVTFIALKMVNCPIQELETFTAKIHNRSAVLDKSIINLKLE